MLYNRRISSMILGFLLRKHLIKKERTKQTGMTKLLKLIYNDIAISIDNHTIRTVDESVFNGHTHRQ